MSPEAQRIAIAEACGWKSKTYNPPGDWMSAGHEPVTIWLAPGREDKRENYRFDLPDHLTDLNAMHEAEKVLTEGQRTDYILDLIRVCQRTTPEFQVCFATATQRAEAFLKTVGRWKPAGGA